MSNEKDVRNGRAVRRPPGKFLLLAVVLLFPPFAWGQSQSLLLLGTLPLVPQGTEAESLKIAQYRQWFRNAGGLVWGPSQVAKEKGYFPALVRSDSVSSPVPTWYCFSHSAVPGKVGRGSVRPVSYQIIEARDRDEWPIYRQVAKDEKDAPAFERSDMKVFYPSGKTNMHGDAVVTEIKGAARFDNEEKGILFHEIVRAMAVLMPSGYTHHFPVIERVRSAPPADSEAMHEKWRREGFMPSLGWEGHFTDAYTVCMTTNPRYASMLLEGGGGEKLPRPLEREILFYSSKNCEGEPSHKVTGDVPEGKDPCDTPNNWSFASYQEKVNGEVRHCQSDVREAKANKDSCQAIAALPAVRKGQRAVRVYGDYECKGPPHTIYVRDTLNEQQSECNLFERLVTFSSPYSFAESVNGESKACRNIEKYHLSCELLMGLGLERR